MTTVAEGLNVYPTTASPTAPIRYLASPADVIALIESGQTADYLLLVRGGTTTFLAPALSKGARGVITMSGAPTSHLGILSREFQVPCIMTVHLTASASRYVPGSTELSHFQEIVAALNGRQARLDCSDRAVGRVLIDE